MKQSRPLISLNHRIGSRSMSAYAIKADEAAQLERDGIHDQAEAAWLKARDLAGKEANKEWADCRAKHCCNMRHRSARQAREAA